MEYVDIFLKMFCGLAGLGCGIAVGAYVLYWVIESAPRPRQSTKPEGADDES